MSFWPGRGLFASRHKRHPRIRVVWRPPEKLNVTDSNDVIDDQPKKEVPAKDIQSKGSKTNQEKSPTSKQGDKKNSSFEKKKSNRGRKRRNVKPISDQSSNSDGSEKLGGKSHDVEGKDEDDEITDEKGLSEASTGDIPVAKKKARKKRFGRRSKKTINRDNPTIVKEENETKLNKIHEAAGGSEDHLNNLEHDWEDAGDSGGQISRCSSSSSLSSSCSHHSLIKHYTNIMMNCCDDQFDEDCNVVKNKIDRILKSQWKDRLNRSKEKPLGSSESQSPISQPPALKHSPSFKLRPARLPLNKKTWSKLKKSNQNSDWLFNNES